MLSPRRPQLVSPSLQQRAIAALFLTLLGTAVRPAAWAGAPPPETASNSQELLTDPFRKEPYLIFPGDPTRMQVLWQLTATDTATIQWGADTTYASGSAQTTEYGADHQHTMTITGLDLGRHYFYRVSVRGVSYRGSFNAAPASSATRLEFMAYGDTRSYPATHDQVAAGMIATWNADPEFQSLALVVGDLVNSGDNEADWTNQFFSSSYRHIREFMAQVPYQSCIGNHEGSGALFVKYFPYPFAGGRYWSFDYGPAHFVIVDQYTSYGPGSAQLQWIASDLAGSTKPWKFICLHEPGWSAGGNHPNNTSVQSYLQPLCVQYGVSIVFGGHNHYYARAVVGGVHHVTTGGGGAPLYQPVPSYPNVVAAARAYHFCAVQIDGARLTFRALDPSGSLLDSFTVRNTTPITCSDISAEPGRGYVDLRWSASLDVPARLQVLRSTQPDGGYEAVSGEMPAEPGETDFAWRDASVRPSTEYWYRIGWREVGVWSYSAPVRIVTPAGSFGFRRIAPNPFGRGASRFEFELARPGRARLDIFDAAGKRVRTLIDGTLGGGASSVTWDGREQDGRSLPAGVYFAKLASGRAVATKKVILAR